MATPVLLHLAIRRGGLRGVQGFATQRKKGAPKGIAFKLPLLNARVSIERRPLRPLSLINSARCKVAGFVLYRELLGGINYESFFDELNLEDSFQTRFVIMELCLWMYAARASAEGHKGAVLREQMVEVLKSDVSQRLVVLKSENPDFANVDVDELFKGVRQTLLDYDEALHGDDAVLAGILWTKFYHTREISDNYLRTLLKLVKKIKLYVKGKPEPFNTFTLQPKYIVMLVRWLLILLFF